MSIKAKLDRIEAQLDDMQTAAPNQDDTRLRELFDRVLDHTYTAAPELTPDERAEMDALTAAAIVKERAYSGMHHIRLYSALERIYGDKAYERA